MNVSQREEEPARPGIVWDKSYEVGHPILDAQHRHIVDLVNALQNAAHGEGLGTVGAVLPYFVRFLENHFETEEAILRQVSYPGVEKHAAEHLALLTQVTQSRQKTAQDGHETDPVRFAATIWAWVHEHTATSDREYAPMLRSLGRCEAFPSG